MEQTKTQEPLIAEIVKTTQGASIKTQVISMRKKFQLKDGADSNLIQEGDRRSLLIQKLSESILDSRVSATGVGLDTTFFFVQQILYRMVQIVCAINPTNNCCGLFCLNLQLVDKGNILKHIALVNLIKKKCMCYLLQSNKTARD